MSERGIVVKLEACYGDFHKRIVELRGIKPAAVYSLHNGLSLDGEDGSYNPIDGLRRMARHVISTLDVEHGNVVLDQGCGVRSIAFRIASGMPFARVVGSNISLDQLDYASEIKRERTGKGANLSNLHFYGGNFLENPFPADTFDRVLFVDSISHSQDTKETVREGARVLKPGGKLVIFDFFALDPVDPEIEQLRDLWISPGLIGVDHLQEIIDESFSSHEITALTPHVLSSLKYMSEVRIPTLSPGSMENGGKLLYKLVAKGKIGYFQVVAST